MRRRCLAMVLVAVACGPQWPVDEDEASGTGDGGTVGGPGGPVSTTGPVTTAGPVTTTEPVSTTGPVTTGPDSTTGPVSTTTTTGPDPIDPGASEGSSSTAGSTSTTGTPTTAGGGGEPGGAGPDAEPDELGDVDLPSADVIAAAVYTDGTLVDFRVQFAAPPFTDQATYDVTWCIEAGFGGQSSCATHASDIDTYLQLVQNGPAGAFVSGTAGVDPCLNGAFEAETNTLRILVPADTFPGAPDFRWILTVTFGGSFGKNEWVPEFDKHEVVWVEQFPPFSGEPTCG